MYNIITLKGELMKKLFILTLLVSAKLFAISYDEAHATLTAAQREHANAMTKASESAARLQTLQNAVSQKASAENVRALNDHVTAHNQLVDHCKLCVKGLEGQVNHLNKNEHHVLGDVFKGRVATRG